MAGKQGKKNRKYDRNRNSPQNTRYKISNRQKTNKERRMQKDALQKLKKEMNPPKIVRGTARKLRRASDGNKKAIYSKSIREQAPTPLQRALRSLKDRGHIRGERN